MLKRYPLLLCLAGALVARVGDEAAGPALLLAGFARTGSTTEASALLAAFSVSAVLGGPVLGALLDGAARPGRLLAGALALYATGLVLVLGELGRLPFAAALVTALLAGLFGPALAGGWSAQLPRVATAGHVPRARALDAMTFGAAALAGPALAGGAAELLGASAAVMLSAGLIAAAVPTARTLPIRGGRAKGPRPGRAQARAVGAVRTGDGTDAHGRLLRILRTAPSPSPSPSLRNALAPLGGALAAGTRAVLGKPLLARATLTSVVSSVAQGMLTACVPLLGEQALGGAGRGAALLLSCTAVSALVANALLLRFPLPLPPDALVRIGGLAQAAAPALALAGRPAPLAIGFLIAGLGEGPQLTALFAVRHREAPEGLRSQVFTTGASLKVTGFALGAAAAGPLAARSLPAALVAATVTALLAAARPPGRTVPAARVRPRN
ncbi:MFS transporter [Streptomyces sp. NPDC058872]|uniref:MFS transporter n=1 Tax=Streptomyces sp. NPDC058872 TaxID=3346661 RepID=UPI0036C99ED2